MLKTAIKSLPMDVESVIDHVTVLALEAILEGEKGAAEASRQLQFEMERVKKKKAAVLDSFFSGEITKEDMQAMSRKYDGQIEDLRQRQEIADLRLRENREADALGAAVRSEVSAILNGEIESEAFYKIMLDRLTVFKDRRLELRLNFLPQVFQFAG